MKAQKASKLLDYLVAEGNHWTSSNVLSDYMSVSTRQIRKYINSINEEAGTTIIDSSNRGYKICMEAYQNYRINADKEIDDSPTTRQNYIIQKLVSEKDGYNIYAIGEELCVSEPTIENDLKIVRNVIKEYHLSIKRDKDTIQMIGSEKKKRNLMSHLISSNSYDNFVLKDEIQVLSFHYHFQDFRTTLRDTFAQNDIFVNDYTLNNTALHLIIMIDRIRNHCCLDEPVHLEKIKNTQQYRVAEHIKEYIEEHYDVIINDAELYNLTLVISNNTTMIDYSFITPDNINEFIEQKYIDIAHKVIHNVENCYYLDPFDEDFITKFTIHVKNMFNRVKNDYYAKNPLTNKIKTTYPLIYDIAVFIAQEFKEDYNVNLVEDEITFIAFHIGSYFENNVQSKAKVSCAFLYADYYSLHKQVMDKIIRQFGEKIDMKYAISINNYKPSLLHADLIISTIDMPFSNTYVVIHPFLTEKDNKHIRDAIEHISDVKRSTALKAYLMNFFDERLFYKNPSFSNKEDAIHHLTDDVVSLNYAHSTLYEDVMERERMSSTAFHDVAVPHSLSKSAKTSFISIAISETPMHWGNHDVHIIALIGVNEDSRKIFSEVFDELIDILSEPIHVKELLLVDNFKEFIDQIKVLMSKPRKD